MEVSSIVWLSPRFTVDDWKKLGFSAEADWQKAVEIVEDRINGRFIEWIDKLIDNTFAGFAVMALDCLLLETLYGFQVGASTKDTKTAYKTVLTAPPFCFDHTLAESFYESVRCGIIHDTETRKGWLIRMEAQSKIVELDGAGSHILNRTMFHATLTTAFKDWVKQLRAGNTALREKMRSRMDEIIKKHYTT
jgi:hypothetical protein